MKHRMAYRQLGRNGGHRRALLRNLVTALLKHGRIETTEAKAKEITPIAEKMITLAKRGDLHARRQVMAYVQERAAAHRLFEELKEHFLDRQGGYVRMVKKGFRKGDGAPVSVVELVGVHQEGKKEKTGSKKDSKGKAEGKVADRSASKKDRKEDQDREAPGGAS